MKKRRQIAAGEGRLLLGDGVQGNARIGDDLLAIGSRDLVELIEPIGLQAFVGPTPGGRADLVLRLQVDSYGRASPSSSEKIDAH